MFTILSTYSRMTSRLAPASPAWVLFFAFVAILDLQAASGQSQRPIYFSPQSYSTTPNTFAPSQQNRNSFRQERSSGQPSASTNFDVDPSPQNPRPVLAGSNRDAASSQQMATRRPSRSVPLNQERGSEQSWPNAPSSKEARAMSPEYWGEEPQYWPQQPSLPAFRADGGRGQPAANPYLRPSLPTADPVPLNAPASPLRVLPHSDLAKVPANSISTNRNTQPPFNSVYRSVVDPDQLDLNPSLQYAPQNGIDQAAEPTQGSVRAFFQPQTMYERGYRSDYPMQRGMPFDTGEPFDFEEKKKQYPPMREIIATGRFFGMAEQWLLKPYFNNDAVLTASNSSFAESFQADHAFESAPRFRLGFESKYGPGAEMQYFQFDQGSRPIEFVSTGATQGTSSVEMTGLASPVSISTGSAGDRLLVAQTLEVHSLLFCVFKEAKLPISRINGMIGFRYASIAQDLQAQVFSPGGALSGELHHFTDFRGLGPNFGLEYYRPVGHTKLEMIGAASGSILLGNRDQFVTTDSFAARRVGVDEMVTIFDVMAGIQYAYHYAEKRSYYARLAAINQVWLNGGTPATPHDDFGFRGVAFAVGFNR